VPLGAPILADIVDQHLETAIHTAMIEVETEAPDFERLPAAFVLARVDPRV
jgi:hypothetical protein